MMPFKRGGSMKVIVVLIITAITLSANYVFAETLKEFEKMIRTEIPYPRNDMYTIAATLPDGKSTDEKNRLYLKIAKALEGKGLIKLVTQGSVTKIQPVENTYDIIRQNSDQNYVLQSISIVLGTFRMNASSMSAKGDSTTVLGERILSNKTGLYDVILKLLPADEVKEYSPSPMQWVISRHDGQIKITETPR